MSTEPLTFRHWGKAPNEPARWLGGEWSEFGTGKHAPDWRRRIRDFLGENDVPWLASRCGKHLDGGSFAVTSDSLIFVPKTRKTEDARRLGRRYLVRNISNLTPSESSISFTYEGEAVEIKCPQVFWQVFLEFPQIVNGTVVVQPEEMRSAGAAGGVMKVKVGCLVGTRRETPVGSASAFAAKGSAVYANYIYDVVLRAKSHTPYYQKLPSHDCRDTGGRALDYTTHSVFPTPNDHSGAELWVAVKRGKPELLRLTTDVREMYQPQTVQAASAAIGAASVRFDRHVILGSEH